MFSGPIPQQSTTWNQCEPTHMGDTYGECTKQGGNTKKKKENRKKRKRNDSKNSPDSDSRSEQSSKSCILDEL